MSASVQVSPASTPRERRTATSVDRSIAGSLPADLAVLYGRYAVSAHRLAYRIIGDRDLADEVVQEAFLCLWRTRHAYRAEIGHLDAWLNTLVHRRAVDALRRRAARPRTFPLDDARVALVAETTRGPEAQACDQDQAQRVLIAIDGLASSSARVLRLALVEGHTNAEIAQLLGIPLGTVKTRIARGRQQVRESVSRESLR